MKSGITLAELIKIGEYSDMSDILERELSMMDSSGMIVELLVNEVQVAPKRAPKSEKSAQKRTTRTRRRWYELQVKMVKNDGIYTVSNTRYTPRRFVQMKTLISFVRERCPDFVAARSKAGLPVIGLLLDVNTENPDHGKPSTEDTT